MRYRSLLITGTTLALALTSGAVAQASQPVVATAAVHAQGLHNYPYKAMTDTNNGATEHFLGKPVQAARANLADLQKAGLKLSQLGGRPAYYLTWRFKNTGKKALKYPNLIAGGFLRTTAGQISGAIILFSTNGVPGCNTTIQATLAPGATMTQCRIVYLPKGSKIASYSYAGVPKNTYWTYAG